MRLLFLKIWENKKICSPTVCQMRLVFLAPPRAYLYARASYSVSPYRAAPPSFPCARGTFPCEATRPPYISTNPVRRSVLGCVLPRRVKRKPPLDDQLHAADPPRVTRSRRPDAKAVLPPRVTRKPSAKAVSTKQARYFLPRSVSLDLM
jgi:hypothetical protein